MHTDQVEAACLPFLPIIGRNPWVLYHSQHSGNVWKFGQNPFFDLPWYKPIYFFIRTCLLSDKTGLSKLVGEIICVSGSFERLEKRYFIYNCHWKLELFCQWLGTVVIPWSYWSYVRSTRQNIRTAVLKYTAWMKWGRYEKLRSEYFAVWISYYGGPQVSRQHITEASQQKLSR